MKIAVYTNILTPYRINFYKKMHEQCCLNGDTFNVLVMASTEPNRNWNYESLKTDFTILLKCKTLIIGDAFLHFNSDLVKTVKQLELDILICAGSYLSPGVHKILKKKKKFGYKTIFWSESHLQEIKSRSLFRKILSRYFRNKIYKKFDAFFYAGELSKDFILSYCSDKAKLIFLPNLVEEELFYKANFYSSSEKMRIKELYNISNNRIVCFTPARLTKVKGIDAFENIINQSKIKDKITWIIAGDGELENTIRKIAEENELDLKLVGFKSQMEIIDLYAISDIFILPSLSDPNPLSCIEAAWAGKPLFISKHCGNYHEVIEEGVNGFSFSYSDVDEALANFEMIVNDKKWRIAASSASVRIAKNQYVTSKTCERVVFEAKNII